MATYDLTTTTPSSIKTGDILNCPYSGSAKQITLPKGTYKLECWGAQGGAGSYSSSGTAGKGGYSYGTLALSSSTTLYLYTGGQGGTGSTSAAGGYNGGGAVTYSADTENDCGGGGGASHIATSSGLLSSLSSSTSSILLVAGGGGGIGWSWSPIGGYGGGQTGGNGSCQQYSGYTGQGGTQSSGGAKSPSSPSSGSTTAGSFGQGGTGAGYTDGGAGGGGGYYGGGGATISAGGGGSGYVNTSKLTSAQTIAGNTTFTSPTGTSETGHTGNGYVRITVIEVKTNLSIYIKNNAWKENNEILFKKTNWINYKDIYMKFNPQSLLPSGYTALEYIESTGTQYIDTGFIPNQDTRIDMVACPTSVVDAGGGAGFVPYGSAQSYNSRAFECYTVSAQYEFNYGTTYKNIGNAAIGQKVAITHNKNNVSLSINDGPLLTMSFIYSSFTTPYTMTLFGTHRSSILCGQQKIYSCQIRDNGHLIRNFIPCKNTNSVVGLWDDVNSQFYQNAGTGTFIAGPIATTSWIKIESL